MIRLLYSSVALLLVACQTPHAPTPLFELSQFESWSSERIELPPDFAPSMPTGEEFLLFAPGMFEPEAEDFWSYVFVMQVTQKNTSVEAIDELFELYYDGLIAAVAEAQGQDFGKDPADVRVTHTGKGQYEAQVRLIDTFQTMKPLTVRMLIQVESDGGETSFLRVQVSPQDEQHEIWKSLGFLAAALDLEGLGAVDLPSKN